MRPFFVYMLRCRDGSYYVGHTDDLEKRVIQHQHGEIPGHTSARRPVELVWHAEMPTRDDALQRELQLKGWTRRKKEALIREDWARVKQLARGPDRSARARPSTSRPHPQSSVRSRALRSGRTERPVPGATLTVNGVVRTARHQRARET